MTNCKPLTLLRVSASLRLFLPFNLPLLFLALFLGVLGVLAFIPLCF